jgi:hypothetical protein
LTRNIWESFIVRHIYSSGAIIPINGNDGGS